MKKIIFWDAGVIENHSNKYIGEGGKYFLWCNNLEVEFYIYINFLILYTLIGIIKYAFVIKKTLI